MDPSRVIGGTETDPSHYIKTSLKSVGFSPAPELEMSWNPGRILVWFLESTRTNLAPRPGRPAKDSTTTINSPKTMLTVVRNPHGFHLVSLLPKGQKWTSHYYIDHNLPEICALHDARDRRKVVIHADNARPHIAKRVKQYLEDNNLKSALYRPYSPDLASSDFFSSATWKDCSKG
jgi:hypothetical protein